MPVRQGGRAPRRQVINNGIDGHSARPRAAAHVLRQLGGPALFTTFRSQQFCRGAVLGKGRRAGSIDFFQPASRGTNTMRSKNIQLPERYAAHSGRVETASNLVEHPEVVARRIGDAVRAVGDRERVVASTDCGFGTFTNRESVIEPAVWLKLAAIQQGADIASSRLWARRTRLNRDGDIAHCGFCKIHFGSADRQRLIDGLRELVCDADDVRPNGHVVVADGIAAGSATARSARHVAHDRLILVRRIEERRQPQRSALSIVGGHHVYDVTC